MAQFSGTGGNDSRTGTTGADLFLLQQGGDDSAVADDGDDIVYFGTTLAAGDSVDGGSGDDRVLIQGNYSLALAAGMLSRVERLMLLSSGDSTYGGGGASPFSYSLSLSDALFGFGTSFIIDASGLAAGEALTLNASAESDSTLYVYGGAGNDILTAGTAAALLDGGAGNDRLDGGLGPDTLIGGLGNDIYIIDDLGDTIVDGADQGDDVVYASVDWSLANNSGGFVETLYLVGSARTGRGNELANLIVGTAAADLLDGAGGNDVLDGGAGADHLEGGYGDDRYIVDDSGDTILEYVGEGQGHGYDTVESSAASYVLPYGVEALTLTGTGAIAGTGSHGSNLITGNAAANTLRSGGGNDTLVGGPGDDIYLVLNEDLGVVGVFPTIVELAGGGTDTVRTDVDYTLPAGVENLVLLYYATGTGNDGANHMTTSAYGGILRGGAGNDILVGDGSIQDSNVLDGGPGADQMHGGAAADFFYVDDPGDQLTDLGGWERVYSTISFVLPAWAADLELLGTEAINGTGNASVNAIWGNEAANVLIGGGGGDALIGRGGDDSLILVGGSNGAFGGEGNDTLTLTSGADAASTGRTFSDLGNGTDHAILDFSSFTGGLFVDRNAFNRDTPGSGIIEIEFWVPGFPFRELLSLHNAERMTLTTGSGDDIVRPHGHFDIVHTGDGDDRITALGAGSNWDLIGRARVDGGPGYDSINLNWSDLGAGQDVVLDVNDPTGVTLGSGDTERYIRNIEQLDWFVTGAGNDRITLGRGLGTSPSQYIETNGGDDTVTVRMAATGLENGYFGLYLGEGTADHLIVDLSASSKGSYAFGSYHRVGDSTQSGDHDGIVSSGGYEFKTLIGGSGDDVFWDSGTFPVDDTVYGGGGNDTLSSESGHDSVHGGAGSDRLWVTQSSNIGVTYIVPDTPDPDGGYSGVFAGAGFGVSYTSIEHFWLQGGHSADWIVAGAGNDTLLGGLASDHLEGRAGNDHLDGGLQTDVMIGGLGDDVYVDDGDSITENEDEGNDEVRTALAAYTLGANLEKLTGLSDVDQVLNGNGLDNVIDGGAGADAMAGGGGNDVYFVDDAGDVVTENSGEGTDEVRTGLGAGSTQPLRIAGQYQLGANVENLTGTGLNQGLRGNALNNVIAAASGSDFINLRDGGDDTVTAGDGRDVLYYGGALTSADSNDAGSAGGDVRGDLLILQGDYSDGLTLGEDAIVGVEKLRILRGNNADFGDTAGNHYSYEITTVDSNVALDGRLVVQAGSLRIGETLSFDGSDESDGSFQVFGGRDGDRIEGGAQSDHLLGRAGDDELIGNGGNDRLRGGLGQDSLEGGAGADIFVYSAQGGAEGYANAVLESTSTGYDILVGFDYGEDEIDLPNAVTGLSTDSTGKLDSASFDADLTSALGSFQAGSAVLFTPDSGGLVGKKFLIVDANGDGAYQANSDFVFELRDAVGTLPATPEFFI